MLDFPFQERKVGRDKREAEERGRFSQEVCVSVPLRVPRPGQNVGKVAHCLSHDP